MSTPFKIIDSAELIEAKYLFSRRKKKHFDRLKWEARVQFSVYCQNIALALKANNIKSGNKCHDENPKSLLVKVFWLILECIKNSFSLIACVSDFGHF